MSVSLPISSGIYQIKHIESGKIYVGSAKNLRLRWKEHRKFLNRGTHHSRHLQSAWVKYGGRMAFEFSILLLCAPDDLLFFEQRALDKFKSYDDMVGYNIQKCARSSLGRVVSDAHRANMKKAGRDRNKRISYNGGLFSVVELAEQHGLCDYLVRNRLRLGWSIERALTPISARYQRDK